MGQKAHPRGLRLGIHEEWDGNWFSDRKYGDLVLEDFAIRRFLENEFSRAGVLSIKVNRKSKVTEAIVKISRPGVVFGKNGMDMGIVRESLSKEVGFPVRVQIVEVKNTDADPKFLAEWIVFQLEKRTPFRRAMKMAIQRAMKAGVGGIRVACAGRLGGVEIARTEDYREGRVPLHTLRADIKFAFSEALTTYGKIGVKVWVYNGEVAAAKPQLVEQQ